MKKFIKSIFNIVAVCAFMVMPMVALAQESEGALESTIGDIYWHVVYVVGGLECEKGSIYKIVRCWM